MATIANIDSILNQIPNPEDLAWNHAMDISGAIHTRLKELGMTQRDLAEKTWRHTWSHFADYQGVPRHVAKAPRAH